MGRPGPIGEPIGRHPGWPARLGPLRVRGGLVELRPVRLRDGAAWSRLRRRDVHHLRPWEPTAPGTWDDRHSVLNWPAQSAALRSAARRGHALPFAILLNGVFCGQVTVGNLVRSALCSAWVGYWVSSEATGGGVATAATALCVDHCFGPVGLHRVEATVRPENVASRRVLDKLGFREEGLHLRYLNVDDSWRDHLVYALTIEEVPGGVVRELLRAGLAEPA
ncbi:MAG TPA: GNAT family protein [Pseudonocardiaceae bacterium]